MKKGVLKLFLMGITYSSIGIFSQLLFVGFLYASVVEAQEVRSVKDVVVEIEAKNESIVDVFQAIETSTDFIFVYDKEDKFLYSTIDFSLGKTSVENILLEISKQQNLSFKQINNSISVKKTTRKPKTIEIVMQGITITGRVTTSEDQSGLPGVNVIVKGTTQGTVTDVEGNYVLDIPDENSILVFSSVGYLKEEVIPGNRTVIDVSLVPDITSLEEIVVVGYGTVKKSDLTSAISRVKGDEIGQRVTPRLDEALQGQMSGVNVQQNSGVPGNAPIIRVRGVGSISSGNSPLFVIDGFPVEDNSIIGNLNMNDVESIEVLKDAASASIYGSRGANGIILITTKKGSAGKAKFSYNGYYGLQKAEKLIEFMNANELGEMFTELRNHYWVQSGGNINDPNEVRPATRRIDPAWTSGNMENYDAQEYVFRTAPIQNHSLSVNGGSENTNYFISLEYFEQDGIARGTEFERISTRMNIESKINKRVKFGLNLSPSYSNQIDRNTEGKDNTLNRILMQPQIMDFNDYYYDQSRRLIVHDYGEYYNGLNRGISVFEFDMVPDERKRAQILSNMFVEFNLLEGLDFRTSLGLSYSGLDRQRFYNEEAGQGTIRSDRWNSWSTNWLWENTLVYKKSIAKHNFSILGGYTAQKEYTKGTNMSGRNHPNDLSSTINNATLISGWGESVNEWSLLSYLGRVTYDYDSRYLFTASIRRDGSSRFGTNNKWGTFPSVSGAWRISEESFFGSDGFISNLKVRASWGETGNNRIGNYAHIATLRTARALFGATETVYPGILPNDLGNPDLGWETSTSTNLGLDVGFIKDRFNLSFEFYNNLTTDLLLNVPIPLVSGFSNQLQNIGEVRNKGFEIDLNTKNTIGAFEWNTRFNFSNNRNEVLKMGPNDTPIMTGEFYAPQVSFTGIGHPIGSFYMLIQEGIFQTQAEVDAGAKWGNEGVGDVKFKDLNGDGVVNNDDRDIVGQPFPIWNFGITNDFRYKNFDLSIFINGAGGHKTYFATGRYYDQININNIKSYTANWNNRWRSPENPGDGRTPSSLSTATSNGDIPSTRRLYDANWWRVKNVTLGYTFPKTVTDKLNISGLRIYATGDNLFLGTEYPGFNPEGVNLNNSESVTFAAGWDYGVYPLTRRVVFGINLSF